jgi:hypothetical protein
VQQGSDARIRRLGQTVWRRDQDSRALGAGRENPSRPTVVGIPKFFRQPRAAARIEIDPAHVQPKRRLRHSRQLRHTIGWTRHRQDDRRGRKIKCAVVLLAGASQREELSSRWRLLRAVVSSPANRLTDAARRLLQTITDYRAKRDRCTEMRNAPTQRDCDKPQQHFGFRRNYVRGRR